MNLLYVLKETVQDIRRAWVSNVFSVLTIAFFLVIIGLLGLVSLNISRITNNLSAQLEIQAYISNVLSDGQISALREKVNKISGIVKVDFVSKEMAANEFRQEFGEQLLHALDENPLPASFRILVAQEARSEARIQQIADKIADERGIDEVVYHYKALSLLNRYSRMAAQLNLLLILFVTMGSLLVVANNIRLVIYARRHIIETMKLVGATRAYIRTPLYLGGIIQGAFAGIVAWTLLFLALYMLQGLLPYLQVTSAEWIAFLVGLGMIYGLLGSSLAIKRYL